MLDVQISLVNNYCSLLHYFAHDWTHKPVT